MAKIRINSWCNMLERKEKIKHLGKKIEIVFCLFPGNLENRKDEIPRFRDCNFSEIEIEKD
jgi:hypothetical protein